MLEEDLSAGERLAIYRTRMKFTKAQAADYHGVDVKMYTRWEKDIGDPPLLSLGGVDQHEQLHILRLRARMSRSKLGMKVGLSGGNVQRIEEGQDNPKRLVEYWKW